MNLFDRMRQRARRHERAGRAPIHPMAASELRDPMAAVVLRTIR